MYIILDSEAYVIKSLRHYMQVKSLHLKNLKLP